MAIGKEIGTWTSNATSITKEVDGAGRHLFTLNCEGKVSGAWNGSTLMTVRVTSSDLKSGTYTATAAVYLDDGTAMTADGAGVLGSAGAHKWQMNGSALVEDGSRIAFEGTMSLGERSLNGKLFEIQ